MTAMPANGNPLRVAEPEPSLLYVSFDRVPAPKGAATHIEAFARSLARAFGSLALVTLSPTADDGARLQGNGLHHTVLPVRGPTLVHRALDFRQRLRVWLADRRFRLVQVRSIYEGLPFALDKARYCDRLLFEVNGLPSVELKYRYPAVADDRDLLRKLHWQEDRCLAAADAVVVPSEVTRQFLQGRGVPADRIRVIPNGVDVRTFRPTPERARALQGAAAPAPDRFAGPSPVDATPPDRDRRPMELLYFGVLAAWQGTDVAVRAAALAGDRFPVRLRVVGPGTKAQVRALQALVRKLGLGDRFDYVPGLPQPDLIRCIQGADATLAPLTACDRNLVQGCSPLKVLESMAVGTPAIASRLPVVAELGREGVHWLGVRPNSVADLAAAIARLRADPALGLGLAAAARARVERDRDWAQAGRSLVALYRELGVEP